MTLSKIDEDREKKARKESLRNTEAGHFRRLSDEVLGRLGSRQSRHGPCLPSKEARNKTRPHGYGNDYCHRNHAATHRSAELALYTTSGPSDADVS